MKKYIFWCGKVNAEEVERISGKWFWVGGRRQSMDTWGIPRDTPHEAWLDGKTYYERRVKGSKKYLSHAEMRLADWIGREPR